MKIFNKSRKIVGINGNALLPQKEMEIADKMREHPVIKHYLKKGVVEERKAEENKKPKNTDENTSDSKEKDAELKSVKAMRKDELFSKALGMGLEVNDDDTVDVLREKIIKALGDM